MAREDDDTINEVEPRDIQEAAQRGLKRLANYRNARVFFLQEYCGPYYDAITGEIGTSPLNMIFNAIRVLVPTLVMNFPKHIVETPYLAVQNYAKLMGLALSQQDIKLNIRDVYRAVLVDAIFTLGIMKTGLCQSDDLYALDDEAKIDAGTVYTQKVDFDNWVVDPMCREHMFADARFMGDKIIVPRQVLLDSDDYDHDLVKQLPRLGNESKEKKAENLSKKNIEIDENFALEDSVEIIELFIPGSNAIVTIPADDSVSFDDYIRVADYYGVKEGPYTLLSLTPPVPGNPLPIPMVGIWYDLHVLANRMAKKISDQAERQKTITIYKRTASDDAKEVQNAGDGDMVAVDDPTAIATLNQGGQEHGNEVHLDALMGWFNMMAGNPEQLGGNKVEAESATGVNVLQQNAAIGLEDMKDLTYQAGASESRKRAFFLHTDPMLHAPMIHRVMTPSQTILGPDGQPAYLQPAKMEDVQVILTPAERRGDFLDFAFKFQPESMGRIDSKTQLQQMMSFLQQVLPAVVGACQQAAALGIQLSAKALLTNAAQEMGITWIEQAFFDPEFQQQMATQMMMGPKDATGKSQQPNGGLLPSILQNGQPGQVQGAPPSPQQQQNSAAQSGAQLSQRLIRNDITHPGNLGAKPPLANA